MAKPKSYFYGKVLPSGQIALEEGEKQRMGQAAHLYKGCDIVISIEAKKVEKTARQNGYFHGLVVPFVQGLLKEEGYNFDYEQTRRWLIDEFLPSQYLKSPHQHPIISAIKLPKRYADSDIEDFAAFIDKINEWVLEFFGTELPPPEKNVLKQGVQQYNEQLPHANEPV